MEEYGTESELKMQEGDAKSQRHQFAELRRALHPFAECSWGSCEMPLAFFSFPLTPWFALTPGGFAEVRDTLFCTFAKLSSQKVPPLLSREFFLLEFLNMILE